jgi:hypothetical protein
MLSEWRQFRTERRQAKAALTILSLEVERNFRLLKGYWEKVNQVESFAEDMLLERLLARLVELPLPEWSYNAWNQQIMLLALVMDVDKIQQVYNFYSFLSAITNSYFKLSTLTKKMKQQITNFEIGTSYNVVLNVPELAWTEFKELVCKVLEQENPLQK